MHESIIYEFPLNERTRTFLRLENCFKQLNHFSQLNQSSTESIWNSQICLFSFIDLLSIIDRNDIRSELIKELDRNIGSLSALFDLPSINVNRLKLTLDELHTQLHALQNMGGRIGAELRHNELINSVKQRLSMTTNVTCFEVPSFYAWLNQTPHKRQDQINSWLDQVKVLQDVVVLLNRLLRESSIFETKNATAGFFQNSLNQQQQCQMVRVAIPKGLPYFPEGSGSKHRISVRFMQNDDLNKRPVQVERDVEFDLSCCSF